MFFSSVFPFLSFAKRRAMILLQLSILSGWSSQCQSLFIDCRVWQPEVTLLAEQRSPIPAPPAGQREWQLCQDPRSCRVCSRNTPVCTASVKLHRCKSSKRNGKARPELCKTILVFQEAIQECCPRDWRHLFTLTQQHLSDATGTRGLAGLPTLIFFLGVSLFPPSLQNPEHAALIKSRTLESSRSAAALWHSS